ncbi:hypothetical protein E2C01_030802 [Portunus trituberculatus]|uniref:Uncharacterized protein n=1 Tax=Portunus trituberculatus TaxID=210409 RepID=A0A5B7EWA4_PORTR|nr:hypothetical protein [Portunus trituberculatus]
MLVKRELECWLRTLRKDFQAGREDPGGEGEGCGVQDLNAVCLLAEVAWRETGRVVLVVALSEGAVLVVVAVLVVLVVVLITSAAKYEAVEAFV